MHAALVRGHVELDVAASASFQASASWNHCTPGHDAHERNRTLVLEFDDTYTDLPAHLLVDLALAHRQGSVRGEVSYHDATGGNHWRLVVFEAEVLSGATTCLNAAVPLAYSEVRGMPGGSSLEPVLLSGEWREPAQAWICTCGGLDGFEPRCLTLVSLAQHVQEA